MTGESDGADLAAELLALVDVLIPGDAAFPSAGVVGVQGKLAERLDSLAGSGAHRVLATRLEQCGGPLRDRPADQRLEIVRRLEAAHPDLFLAAHKTVSLTYYENPAVHAAIRQLGHPYNTHLQPDGYTVAPFDDAVDKPNSGRGRYISTADVRRVDLSGLDFLQSDGPRNGE